MPVRRAREGDVYLHVFEADDLIYPAALHRCHLAGSLHAELHEECQRSGQVVDHDPHVVHSPEF